MDRRFGGENESEIKNKFFGHKYMGCVFAVSVAVNVAVSRVFAVSVQRSGEPTFGV